MRQALTNFLPPHTQMPETKQPTDNLMIKANY